MNWAWCTKNCKNSKKYNDITLELDLQLQEDQRY